MIVSFGVENFRSIKKRTTISFLPTKQEDNTQFPAYFEKDGTKFSKGVGVFGKNASGKSNLTNSIVALANIVLLTQNAVLTNGLAWVTPFAFSKENRKMPTIFDLEFTKGARHYFYHLAVTSKEILEEALDVRDERRRMVFLRKAGEEPRFCPELKGNPLVGLLLQSALPAKPFVTQAAQINLPYLRDVFYFFQNDFISTVGTGNPAGDRIGSFIASDPNYHAFLVSLLHSSDLSIDEVKAKKTKLRFPLVPDAIGQSALSGPVIEQEIHQVITIHKSQDGFTELGMGDESLGTQKVMALSGGLYHAIREGKLLVVDEFGSSLHHELSTYLLSLFYDPDINRNGAQILFNSQDALLLNEGLLRRDQIYLTESVTEGDGTEVVNLSEYSPRKGENIARGFLGGRYVEGPRINPGELPGL